MKAGVSADSASVAPQRRYRIDFGLIVITGHASRYASLRPIVESDQTIRSRWYPIRTWIPGDWLQIFPDSARVRLRHLIDSWPLLMRADADAVILQAFETYTLYGLVHRLLGSHTVIVNNFDGAKKNVPQPGPGLKGWLHKIAVDETDLFVPWSTFAANEAKEIYPESAERMLVLHPGIDLEVWQFRGYRAPRDRFHLLYVGGDLKRKGLETLLTAYENDLASMCRLSIVTNSIHLHDNPEIKARIDQMKSVDLYCDLPPRGEAFRRLYEESDAFVLPTNDDTSSLAALEAMATGLPVVISNVGAIPDIVRDGETGLLVPPGDPAAVSAAVNRLRTSGELRKMLTTRARDHVELHFDARKNADRLLDAVKKLVRERPSGKLAGRRGEAG